MMKLSRLFAWLGAVWLTGCHLAGVDGNGQRQDEVRDVAAFSRVKSDGDLDVQVTQADVQSVTVSIDSNLLPMVETRVSGDTLYIEEHGNIDRMLNGPHVLITAPALAAAKLSGSGNMTIDLDEPSSALDLYLSGSGDVRFTGTTAAIGAYLSGSGNLSLSGQTSDLDASLDGSGAIRARDLSTDSASIDLSGSGDIAATVQSSAKVSLSGSGDVDLYGDAAVDAHDTGSGDITRH